MDRILVYDLAARCVIGISGDERREKQDVLINLSLYADLSRPAKSDRIEDTVDYRAIKKKVLAMVEKSSFQLLEALAEAIAQTCLAEQAILRVAVRVEKPSALRFARSVGVEISRGRDE